MIVAADTTPLNYLVLTGKVELLAKLFGRVVIPPAVLEELRHVRTPEVVREWITLRPAWLTVRMLAAEPDADLSFWAMGNEKLRTLLEEDAEWKKHR